MSRNPHHAQGGMVLVASMMILIIITLLGLSAMRSAGQLTIAQSRESASVWGMPRAAASVAVEVLATQDIPRTLLRWLDLRAGG